jgi:hypothetical protein
MKRHSPCSPRLALLIGLVVVIGAAAACRSARAPAEAEPGPWWDVDRHEILSWRADHPEFGQDYALEASGLAATRQYLYATSEKYRRMLVLDPGNGWHASTIRLKVPRHAELEGVAFSAGSLYFSDEAYAAVYRVDLPDEESLAAGGFEGVLPVTRLPIEGLAVAGGKIGLEGIVVSPLGDRLWLLLERSHRSDEECVSPLYPLQITSTALVLDGEPISIELEDCNWRLTGLELWRGMLLALKTQYPGERYEVIAIDPETGRWRVVLEMTELLRSVRSSGWGNNVEGIAVAEDGTLYLIGDNAVTGIIDDPVPPRTDERALFLAIPPTRRMP